MGADRHALEQGAVAAAAVHDAEPRALQVQLGVHAADPRQGDRHLEHVVAHPVAPLLVVGPAEAHLLNLTQREHATAVGEVPLG